MTTRRSPATMSTTAHTEPEAQRSARAVADRRGREDARNASSTTFGDKSFAILLVLLLGVPALPLPTGGVTHVFEMIAALIALELIAGRREVWLPQRWRSLELAGARQQRFIAGLMKLIRRLERFSRPRLRFLFHQRFTDIAVRPAGDRRDSSARSSPHRSAAWTRSPRSASSCSRSACCSRTPLVVLVAILLGAAGIALELALGAAALHGISSIL